MEKKKKKCVHRHQKCVSVKDFVTNCISTVVGVLFFLAAVTLTVQLPCVNVAADIFLYCAIIWTVSTGNKDFK